MLDTLRIVEISGAPFERGVQYGRAAADLIDISVAYYEAAFRSQVGMDWKAIREYALRWLPLCQDLAPDVLDELRGVADGCGRDIADLLALNLRGEIIYDLGARAAAPAENVDADERESTDGCTSFSLTGAAAGDGHIYAGQNWDWRAATAKTILILRIVQDPEPTIVMQVEAGQIGRHGVNSAGIALNANGLGGRFIDGGLGMPQTFIRRMVLNQDGLADAINLLVRTTPHISSNALLTVREGFSIDLEITPTGIDWLYPTDGLLVHGNHYDASVPAALAGRYRPISADSLFRVPRARSGLELARETLTSERVVDVIRDAMSDHLGYPESVCTHANEQRPLVRQWSTLLSSCVDLTTGEYRVAGGTPCDHPYELLPWNVYDGPGDRRSETTANALEMNP